MLYKRRKQIISKQHFTDVRKKQIRKYKKNYKVIDPHFGRYRETRHIYLPISKYG